MIAIQNFGTRWERSITHAAVAVKICTLDVSEVRIIRPIANSAVKPPIYNSLYRRLSAVVRMAIAMVGSMDATMVTTPEVNRSMDFPEWILTPYYYRDVIIYLLDLFFFYFIVQDLSVDDM